ncbi:hypothetical protein EAW52_10705 [Pseudomonas sp. LTJR-52]|nr:hypothetical protein EAW52_10705 [Pseudomonas sp. LTJR-52]
MNGPKCRWCGSQTEAEYVDVGIGYQQVTGGQCWDCGALELGPHLVKQSRCSEVEMATLWHGPVEDCADFSPFNPEQQDFPF